MTHGTARADERDGTHMNVKKKMARLFEEKARERERERELGAAAVEVAAHTIGGWFYRKQGG